MVAPRGDWIVEHTVSGAPLSAGWLVPGGDHAEDEERLANRKVPASWSFAGKDVIM